MNYSDLQKESLRVLTQKASTNLSWFILFPIPLTTNLLVALTILNSKSLHNKSHYVILSHSLAEIVYSIAMLCLGLARYLQYYFSIADVSSQPMCALKQGSIDRTGDHTRILMLAIAVDRFLCINAPIFYRTKKTLVYIVVFNATCWAYSILSVSLSYVGSDKNKLVAACLTATSYSPVYSYYRTIQGNVAAAITAAIYTVTSLIMWRRYKQTNFVGESQRSEWRRQMDLDVFFAMVANGAIYIISLGTNAVVAAVSLVSPLDIQIILTQVTTVAIFTNCASHLFVYLWFNRMFRKAFFVVVMRKTDNTVQPFPTQHMT